MIKHSKGYLVKLYNTIGEAIFTVKMPERKIESINSKVKIIFGYTPDECRGKNTAMFYPSKKDFNYYGRRLKIAIKEGKSLIKTEQLLKRKNGEIFPSEITTTFFKENNKIVGVISIVRDISERKLSEEKLKFMNTLLMTQQETSLDGILISDDSEKWFSYNQRFLGMWRVPSDIAKLKPVELALQWVLDKLEDPKQFIKRVKYLYKHRNEKSREKITLADGRIFDCYSSPMFAPDAKYYGRVWYFRDVTEEISAQEKLWEQSKTLEKKNIALSEIIGQTQLEKRRAQQDIMANVETLLLPMIQKIKLKGESRKYIKLLQNNLQELTSSFGMKLSNKKSKLTPREIDICNMIKNGFTSKEIGAHLNISIRTTEKHRENIRKKLGIIKKDFNLASFLKTL